MLSKDLKKFGLFISGLLTAFFEAIANLIPQLNLRQILNPISILLSITISTLIIHSVKRYSNKLLIRNNEDRIKEIESIVEVEKLKSENFKLKKENSKIDLLF